MVRGGWRLDRIFVLQITPDAGRTLSAPSMQRAKPCPWSVARVGTVGVDPIAGQSYTDRRGKVLPLPVSDHKGLLLTIEPRAESGV